MNPKRMLAVARKESIHILRDARSLTLAFFIPMVLLALFGFALTLDLERVPLGVWDQSGTAHSRDLVSAFSGSRYFSLEQVADGYAPLQRGLDDGSLLVALVIPRDFAQKIDAGRLAAVQVFIDGSDANTATLALGYAETVVEGFSEKIRLEEMRRASPTVPRPALDTRGRVCYNPDMESRNLIIPGQIAVIMVILASLLTSLTFAKEWENGTMEQLVSTPVRGSELVLGKLLPYVVIGMGDVFLSMFMAKYVFQVPMRGSGLLFVALAFVFLVGSLAMGMFISILCRIQLNASQISMVVTYMPALLLSGLVFAIRNMPPFVQGLTYLFPARYFIAVTKGVYMKGLGVTPMLGEVAFMIVFSTVMTALCVACFRKRLA